MTIDEMSLARSGVSLVVNPSKTHRLGGAVGHRLVIQPESDTEFVTHVYAVSDLSETAEALESALRPKYPTVVVHKGIEDLDGTVRWYVYRDGRWHA